MKHIDHRVKWLSLYQADLTIYGCFRDKPVLVSRPKLNLQITNSTFFWINSSWLSLLFCMWLAVQNKGVLCVFGATVSSTITYAQLTGLLSFNILTGMLTSTQHE